MPNGTEVDEGEFVKLQSADIPLTSDIVFIVEAKDCNADLKNKRNMDSLVSLLQKELVDSGVTDNRSVTMINECSKVFILTTMFSSHLDIQW